MNLNEKVSREQVLKGLIVLPALAAAFVASSAAADAAKSSKKALKYQDKPNGTSKCSGCRFFIPGKTKTAAGTCSVVAGNISPNGWCIAYAGKS